MNGGIAVARKVEITGELPNHAWKNMTGKGREHPAIAGNGGNRPECRKIVRMQGAGAGISPLSDVKANGMLGRLIIEKACAAKVRLPDQAEKNAWTAWLLAENIMRDSHSC
ncbi:MAG: hypothetical protein WC861_03090 [Candidatus Micrarchaeia archaeon]|jgi:hypothetical protein